MSERISRLIPKSRYQKQQDKNEKKIKKSWSVRNFGSQTRLSRFRPDFQVPTDVSNFREISPQKKSDDVALS